MREPCPYDVDARPENVAPEPVTTPRGVTSGSCAVLRCGRRLDYEADDLVPPVGDLVPCKTHGYCSVRDAWYGSPPRRPRTRQPRTVLELLEFLAETGPRSLHTLQRQGFTLRLLMLAARQGRVQFDDLTGIASRLVGVELP